MIFMGHDSVVKLHSSWFYERKDAIVLKYKTDVNVTMCRWGGYGHHPYHPPFPEKKDNHMGAFLSLVSEIFSELDKNKSESKFVF